jgi:predicted urease superfamily metal-dependent hydrolase
MALGAWALRRFPRAGGTLAAATVALTAWELATGGLG